MFIETFFLGKPFNVGVKIDPHNKEHVLRGIAKSLDLMAYDLMRIDNQIENPKDLLPAVKRLIKFASGKKLPELATGRRPKAIAAPIQGKRNFSEK